MTNNIKATATANVSNGVASTSNINYNESLVAGQTYTINAEYEQNNKYMRDEAVGELEIQRIPTTTTISCSSSIELGANLTVTVTVKDNKNANITRGVLTIYDGSTIIQSNYAITGNTTQVTFIPSTTGTHSIKAVYTDTQGEYNSSTSAVKSVSVTKQTPQLIFQIDGGGNNPTTKTMYYDDTITITGTLQKSDGTKIANSNVQLKDYDNVVKTTVTTNSNGAFTVTYHAESWNLNNGNIKLYYAGTNEINEITKSIKITLQRHTVTLTSSDANKFTESVAKIVTTVKDENNTSLTDGTVTYTVTPVITSTGTYEPLYYPSPMAHTMYRVKEVDDNTSITLQQLDDGVDDIVIADSSLSITGNGLEPSLYVITMDKDYEFEEDMRETTAIRFYDSYMNDYVQYDVESIQTVYSEDMKYVVIESHDLVWSNITYEFGSETIVRLVGRNINNENLSKPTYTFLFSYDTFETIPQHIYDYTVKSRSSGLFFLVSEEDSEEEGILTSFLFKVGTNGAVPYSLELDSTREMFTNSSFDITDLVVGDNIFLVDEHYKIVTKIAYEGNGGFSVVNPTFTPVVEEVTYTVTVLENTGSQLVIGITDSNNNTITSPIYYSSDGGNTGTANYQNNLGMFGNKNGYQIYYDLMDSQVDIFDENRSTLYGTIHL